jgi:hypothetical protein
VNLITAFIAACNAFVAWVDWKISTDLDNDEDELDYLGNLMERNPSANTELQILRLRQRIQRKKQQGSTGKSSVGDVKTR